MKTERNILVAFVLNLTFSIFEFIGGIFTGSVAILSDALHDFGDALGIGFSFFMEKKSKGKPDEKYTYGYARYSVLGSAITTLILIIGSTLVIYYAVQRILNPVAIDYQSMIVLAIIGVCVNGLAVFFTSKGESLNQKAVNLHLLEDVFGWLIVLIGAVVMSFTNFVILDPVLSILLSVFILFNALKNIRKTLDVFLEKIPRGLDVHDIVARLKEENEIQDVHHVHIWSIDGINNCATMHLVTDDDAFTIKEKVRKILNEMGVSHITIEVERTYEKCFDRECSIGCSKGHCHHHHHHH